MTEAAPSYRVLVVDDDVMVADIHRRFVDATAGFVTVAVAHDAVAAREAVERVVPDLILLDVYLPGESGLDLLRTLRGAGNHVPVVLVTAARELDTVRQALSGGASDYLVKPFVYTQLADKLIEFRRRATALSDASGVDQETIDSLFGTARSSPMANLPKGLSRETGRLVLDVVREAGEVSATECAERAGMSRVSARRYLEHFASTGAVVVRLEYGRAGRPVRRFRSS